jgi:hypothetical protein
MHLNWTKSYSVSALHTAECCWGSANRLIDQEVAQRMQPSADALGTCLHDADSLHAENLWNDLIPLGSSIASNSALANEVLTKRLDGFVEQSLVQRLTGCITDVEATFKNLFPKYLEQIDFRVRPLQEQWIGYGNGFLAHIARLTSRELLISQADVVALQPVQGGGGKSHHEHGSVRIEAVLANPLTELPELVRLGWLISQLYNTSTRHSLGFKPDTLHRLVPLAMLVPSLAAAQVLELARCDEPTAAMAIEHWHIAVPKQMDLHTQLIPSLMEWWEQYLHLKSNWDVALQALAHRLGLHLN